MKITRLFFVCFIASIIVATTPVLAGPPPMILNTRPATAGLIDGRWAGMVCDGTNDDSAAFRTAVSWVTNNGVLWWPGRALLKPSGTTPAAALTGLTNVTFIGSITNNDFSMSGANWKTLAALTSTGTVAFATASSPHGYSAGQFIGVYCSGNTNYGGVIQVLNAGLDATHFAYNTLGGTPAGAGSGTMQATTLDFATPILDGIKLDHCKFFLTYEAPNVWRGLRHRLGRVLLRLNANGTNDNHNVSGELTIRGASYGIWSGNYLDARFGHCVAPDFKIKADNVGYGAAFWGSGEGGKIEFEADDVHRGVFWAGARRVKLRGKVSNFDVAGALFTSEFDGVTNWGCEDVDAEVEDGGSTQGTSYFNGSARYLINIALDSAGPTNIANYQNIFARSFLKVNSTNGQNVVAMGMTQEGQTNSVINNVKFKYTIDRSQVTTSVGFGPSYEFFMRAGGIVKRAVLEDCSVLNSTATVTNQNCKRDINLPNIASDGWFVKRNLRSDSVAAETLTGGFSMDGLGGYVINASPTVRRFPNVSTGALEWSAGGNAIFPAGVMDLGSPSSKFRKLYLSTGSVPPTIYVTDPQFGAVGDYTGSKTLAGTGTDNRLAIQAALDSAHTNGVGGRNDYLTDKRWRVVVPEGKYYISAPTNGMPSLTIPLGVEFDFHEAELHFDIPPCNYTNNGILEPNPAWCAILAGPLANIRVGQMQIAAGKDQTYGGTWYGLTLDGIRVQESDVGWITGEGRDHYIFGFFRGACIRILASYDMHVENVHCASSAFGIVDGYMGNAFDAYTLYRGGSAAERVSTSLWVDNCVFRNIYRTAIDIGVDNDWHNPSIAPGPVSGGLEYISGSKAAQGGPISIQNSSFENVGWAAIIAYTPVAPVFITNNRMEECDDATTSVGAIYANSTSFKVSGLSFGSTGLRSITLANYGSANSVVTCVPNLLFRSDGVDVGPLLENIYAPNSAVNSAIFCSLSANGRLPSLFHVKAGTPSQWQGVGAGMHGLIPGPLDGGRIWSVSTVGLAPLETPNGSLTNFSFVNGFTAQIPQRVLIDGQMLYGTNLNGSVNWTWGTTNITIPTAPTKDVRAYF